MTAGQVLRWLRDVFDGRGDDLAKFLELAGRVFIAVTPQEKMQALREVTELLWRVAIDWSRGSASDLAGLGAAAHLNQAEVEALAYELRRAPAVKPEGVAIDTTRLVDLAERLGPLVTLILSTLRK